MSQKHQFALDPKYATGAIEVDSAINAAIGTALLTNAPLPAGDNVIASAGLSLANGQPIKVGPAQIGFSADANAALGIFSTAGRLRDELLRNSGLAEEVASAIEFPSTAKFLMMRWGYDLKGSASGTVALAPAANVNFSAAGETKGYFAIVRGAGANDGSRDSLTSLVTSWKLPSQIRDIADMPEAAVMITEVDGSFSAAAKAIFGYEFSWIRAIDGLGLKGDIGLKLKAGLTASLGFGMAGKYAVVLMRESDARSVRMRLYKMRAASFNMGLDASVTASPVVPAQGSLEELIKAISGTHEQQVMKLLGAVKDWTDANQPIFGPFVNLADTEARKLIQSITGVSDLSAAFDDVKARIQGLFDLWETLPHTAAQFLWANIPQQQAISQASAVCKQVAAFSSDDLRQFIKSKLGDNAYFETTAGKALLSLALNGLSGLFNAATDSTAAKQLQDAALTVSSILDGSALEELLRNLQKAVDEKLNLQQIVDDVNYASLDSLDAWLKARLESLLEKQLVGADGMAALTRLRDGLRSIFQNANDWYDKARKALKQDYAFTFNATYQKTSTTSALLDATFDFDALGSQARQGLEWALQGKFDQLLTTTLQGVRITDGVLAYALHRESHVALALPYFSTQETHITDSLARLYVASADEGGLVFGLQGTDSFTSRNNFNSALTIALKAPAKAGMILQHGPSASYRYCLKSAVKSLTSTLLGQRFKPYADAYMGSVFQQTPPGTFAEWATLVAPKGGKFGDSLVSMNLALSPDAAGAWMDAPAEEGAPAYKRVSIALQREFKKVLHGTYFGDIRAYNDVTGDPPSFAVLVFCAIPPCSDVKLVNNGDGVAFLGDNAPGKEVYWDYRDPGLKEKVFFAPQTVANLRVLLAAARQHLTDAGDPNHKLRYYADSEAATILQAALKGIKIDFLFPVEAGLVRGAMKAGRDMAQFRQNQFANPEAARKALAKFGAEFSDSFNTQLKNFAVDNALMPLGTMIYAAGAAALNPQLSPIIVQSMLMVQMLADGANLLNPADKDILHTARVIGESASSGQLLPSRIKIASV